MTDSTNVLKICSLCSAVIFDKTVVYIINNETICSICAEPIIAAYRKNIISLDTSPIIRESIEIPSPRDYSKFITKWINVGYSENKYCFTNDTVIATTIQLVRLILTKINAPLDINIIASEYPKYHSVVMVFNYDINAKGTHYRIIIHPKDYRMYVGDEKLANIYTDDVEILIERLNNLIWD
jgi:hypothetical protein